ncbi:MAG: hypothetical protein AAF497_18255, partial [Planctomycetota bacterium]
DSTKVDNSLRVSGVQCGIVMVEEVGGLHAASLPQSSIGIKFGGKIQANWTLPGFRIALSRVAAGRYSPDGQSR